jgi:hypothetical protein
MIMSTYEKCVHIVERQIYSANVPASLPECGQIHP